MEIQCTDCGNAVQAKRKSRSLCGDCRQARTQLAVKANEKHQKVVRASWRSNLRCQGCGRHIEAQRSDAKWCAECKIIRHKEIERDFETRHRHICRECGKEISRTSNICQSCSAQAGARKRSGENNHNWKGGRVISKQGYVYLLVSPEKRKGHRYQSEHRLVWEEANGPIPEEYAIHHKNKIKHDNRLENLECLSRSAHSHQHGEKRIHELEAEIAELRSQLNA